MLKKHILVFIFLTLITPPVAADICLPEFGPGNSCTANDFTLTDMQVSGPSDCIEGEIIPTAITLRIGMEPTADERYDIGIFVGNNSNLPIGGSSCTFSSLSPIEPVFDGGSGSGPYRDLDGDSCGDTANADGEVFRDIVLTDVLCQDSNNDGKLDVAYALTWKQNKNEACASPDNPNEFISDQSSKCINWVGDLDDVVVIPPQPDLPSMSMTKTPFPNAIHSGDEVTYSVSVNNDGNVSLTLTSLIDDIFANLNGKGSCDLPKVIDAGGTYNCTFAETIVGSPNFTHINTVEAKATDGNAVLTESDSAAVTIIDSINAAISGVIWSDFNADGVSQENEPGIDEVTLELHDSLGTIIRSTITSLGGEFNFIDLPAGSYRVLVIDNNSILNGTVLTGGVEPLDVSINTGQIFTGANFGYARAAISVLKIASPSVIQPPSDDVSYTATISNTGPLEVTLVELTDNAFGDLNGLGNCTIPQTISVGNNYSCNFTQLISGNVGDIHQNSITAVAKDQDGNTLFSANDETVTFTDANNGAIGNFIWFDTNRNGIPDFDDGEEGIDGVTLQLRQDTNNDGNYDLVVDNQSTLFGGRYNFIDLPAGSYQVAVTDTEDALLGLTLTGAIEPLNITLVVGQVYSNADFGYNTPLLPEISVIKTADPTVVNAPGANVTYTVEVKNTGPIDVVLETLLDDQFGDFKILGGCVTPQAIIIGDTYICSFTGSVAGNPGDVHINNMQASVVDRNGSTAHQRASASVSIIDSFTAAIGDQIWHDINANGLLDAGESGIPGISVELLQNNIVIATTETDQGGVYAFLNRPAGPYQVRVTDTRGTLSGSLLTGGTDPHDITLAVGQIYQDADFGYAKAQIQVFKSGDQNFVQVPDADVSYTITISNIGFVDVTPTELSDNIFGNLNGQGDCQLPITLKARTSYACTVTKNIAGNEGDRHINTVTANAVDRDGNLITDKNGFSVQFVNLKISKIGLLVWNDENNNGVWEPSEPGLDSVTLELKEDADLDGSYETVIATAITQVNGLYQFRDLAAGKYQLDITDQYGIVSDMTLTAGTDPHLVSLGVGQLYFQANFGYYRKPIIPPVEPPPPPINPSPSLPVQIPTLSEWGLLLLSTILAVLFMVKIRRRTA